MQTTKILPKSNHLDHNHHTDSDDDDGNQRQKRQETSLVMKIICIF